MALSIAIWHFYLQITRAGAKRVFLASHFVKSEFSEVIKMCDF